MKKLLFLLLLVLYIQCETQDAKENCGTVTEKLPSPLSMKSKPSTISISYQSCEYIVFMPQSKDSFALIKKLEGYNLKPIKVSGSYPSMRLYGFSPINTDTNPKPLPQPIPVPVRDPNVFRNIWVFDFQGKPISQFELMDKLPFGRASVTKWVENRGFKVKLSQ